MEEAREKLRKKIEEYKKEGAKIFVVRESLFQSICSDIFSLGGLFGAFYLNHKFLGSSIIMQIVLAVLFFMFGFNRGSKKIKIMSVKEAKEYFCNQ